MMKNVLTALLLFSACALAQPGPTSVAIRNVKIVTVSGPAIEKGTVVLRDGLIVEDTLPYTPVAEVTA